MEAKENALEIVCRLRPIKENDDKQTTKNNGKIYQKSETILAIIKPCSLVEQHYYFGHIFDFGSTQEQIFERTTIPMIEALFAGQDALLLAYGATGSGKSHTITGNPFQPGIVPRLFNQLFAMIRSNDNDTTNDEHISICSDKGNHFVVRDKNEENGQDELNPIAEKCKKYQRSAEEWLKQVKHLEKIQMNNTNVNPSKHYSIFVSFVEIYNDFVYDLFAIQKNRKALHLGHDLSSKTYAQGSTVIQVKSFEHAIQTFLVGLQNRQTSATILNQTSSRSHSVFNVYLVSYEKKGSKLCANQMTIVDLAGVERTKMAKTTGISLNETNKINNSLMSLRNCFDAILQNQTNKGKKRVPYRESKLTFLLKAFFEENKSLIKMITCIKLSLESFDDNIHVIEFGKKVQNVMIEIVKPTNEDKFDSSTDVITNNLNSNFKTLDQFDHELTQFNDNFKFASLNQQDLVDQVQLFLNNYEKDAKNFDDDFNKSENSIIDKCNELNSTIQLIEKIKSLNKNISKNSDVNFEQSIKEELTSFMLKCESESVHITDLFNSLYEKMRKQLCPPEPPPVLTVFERLYQQTPNRLKVKKFEQTVPGQSERYKTNNRVAEIKKLFTPIGKFSLQIREKNRPLKMVSAKIQKLSERFNQTNTNMMEKLKLDKKIKNSTMDITLKSNK
ncbi:Kinesin-like protein kif23 [Blomia tropicalis]|nr:Kinesin-like protein kif23 [Blomia tropicalis]